MLCLRHAVVTLFAPSAQVSILFKDHPDLLRDFTYFLPDAVQPLAEERLRKAAQRNAREVGVAAGRRGVVMPSRKGPAGRGYDRVENVRVPTADGPRSPGVGTHPGKSYRNRIAQRNRRRRDEELYLQLPPGERQFFLRVKAALGSRCACVDVTLGVLCRHRLCCPVCMWVVVRSESWREFVKCLDLYAQDVVNRQELLSLLQDIFGLQHAALLQEFKSILVSRGTLPGTANPEDNWFSLPVSEIDFTSCQQCTPSYRALPPHYPKLQCSERLDWEREILNDDWVSVPTGSEDFSFKNMRKNQYEEALVRCEDERYEIDMVIDNNASAIQCLMPLNSEIALLKSIDQFDWQFRLDRRSLGVLHLKAIARIYGEHGNEALELLRKNPAGAIPILLKVPRLFLAALLLLLFGGWCRPCCRPPVLLAWRGDLRSCACSV